MLDSRHVRGHHRWTRGCCLWRGTWRGWGPGCRICPGSQGTGAGAIPTLQTALTYGAQSGGDPGSNPVPPVWTAGPLHAGLSSELRAARPSGPRKTVLLKGAPGGPGETRHFIPAAASSWAPPQRGERLSTGQHRRSSRSTKQSIWSPRQPRSKIRAVVSPGHLPWKGRLRGPQPLWGLRWCPCAGGCHHRQRVASLPRPRATSPLVTVPSRLPGLPSGFPPREGDQQSALRKPGQKHQPQTQPEPMAR